MRQIIIIAIVSLLIGCQTSTLRQKPVVYEFMPDSVEIFDSLLVPINQPKDIDKYDDFKSISINSGTGLTCEDDSCTKEKEIDLPAGTVVSDRKMYELAHYRIMFDNVNKRMIITTELLDDYYKQIKTAERVYSNRIEYLENKSERSWFEKNAAYIGFVAGIISTIAVEYITVQAIK